MFSWLQLAIGAYLLYAAITGKGKVFDNEFLKVPREEYVKKLRILAAIAGVVLTVSSVLEMVGAVVPGSPLGWVSWALGLASILPMMVYSAKATDKAAAKANQRTAQSAAQKSGGDPLRSAFVFDEEDEETEETK